MEEDLHRSLDSVMEVAAMQFLQLRPFSRMVAEEVALLRLLEEIAGGTLTIATRDVLKEVCSMKKHAMRGVTTMKTKLKDMTLHRLVPKKQMAKEETIGTEGGIMWDAIQGLAVEIGVCHSSKLLTTL